MTAMISSTLGGSAGYRTPLLRGGRPAWNPGAVAGDRRRPARSSSCSDMMPLGFVDPVRASRDYGASTPALVPFASALGPLLETLASDDQQKRHAARRGERGA